MYLCGCNIVLQESHCHIGIHPLRFPVLLNRCLARVFAVKVLFAARGCHAYRVVEAWFVVIITYACPG